MKELVKIENRLFTLKSGDFVKSIRLKREISELQKG